MKTAALCVLGACLFGCEAYDRDGFARLIASRGDASVTPFDGSMDGDALDAGDDVTARDATRADRAAGDVTPPRDVPVADVVALDRVTGDDVVTPRDVPVSRDVAPDDAGPACSPLRVPAALPSGTVDPEGARGFVVAMRHVSLGMDAVAWRTAGYDRDDLCTLASSPPGDTPCAPRLGGMSVPDGERGRDNAFGASLGAFLETLGASLGFSEAGINANIDAGAETLALRVSGLGGGDDPAVTVEWLPVVNGLRGMGAPAWSGEDQWSVSRTLAYDPGTTNTAVQVTNAYARGNTLVAELPAHTVLALPITRAVGDDFVVHLVRAAIVLRLTDDRTTATAIDITGAWSVTDAVRDAGYFGMCAPAAGGGVDMATWSLFSAAVDRSADIPVSGRTPTVACDAVSLGFHGELSAVTLRGDGVRVISRCR